ncbi:MAG: heme exporter protein CcmD [Rhodobacteraceae bacterium]|nr:heme exporter protein CcmD [Paracoccaceae bacterium]
MPELGAHAVQVLASWAIGLLVLAILIGASIRDARRTRRRLQELERSRKPR